MNCVSGPSWTTIKSGYCQTTGGSTCYRYNPTGSVYVYYLIENCATCTSGSSTTTIQPNWGGESNRPTITACTCPNTAPSWATHGTYQGLQVRTACENDTYTIPQPVTYARCKTAGQYPTSPFGCANCPASDNGATVASYRNTWKLSSTPANMNKPENECYIPQTTTLNINHGKMQYTSNCNYSN